jgi:hypothetical protein
VRAGNRPALTRYHGQTVSTQRLGQENQVLTRRGIHAAASLLLSIWLCAGGTSGGEVEAFNFDSQVVVEGAAQSAETRSAQVPIQGVSKQIEAELVLEPRAAAPGSAIKLVYTISSYEDTDERVRLRIEAGPGWNLLDNGVEGRQLLLEKWENIEGELYMLVPDDARVGDRQLVRLLVELVDEAGVIQAQAYASVSQRGGARPGVPSISTTATVGLSRLGAGGFEGTQKLAAVTMSTKFGRQSTLSFFYDRGLRAQLSNFRFEEARTRLSGNLRHAGWDVSFGNYVPSPGHSLSGPYVLGRGASVSRPAGRLVAELVAAQPNTIGGEAGGRLLRGRAGVRTPRLLLAFSASDFSRPIGGYTTLPSVQQRLLDADEEDRLEIERRLTANAASNRVTGLGLDAEFRPAAPHQFTLRTGGLWVSNAAGAHAGGPAAEASYAYSSKPANFNIRWREAPPTVQGISIMGDELAADGSLRVTGDLRLVGYAYQNASDTVGSDFSSSGDGGSLGMRFTRGVRRLEVRGNYRETEFTMRTVRSTVSVGLGMPIGPLSVSASADIGTQDNGWQAGRVAFYRGEVRWSEDSGTLTLTATHSEVSGAGRQRVDLIGSWKVRAVELAYGAWATRGYGSGGLPGAWTNIGLPIGGGRFLMVALDYSSPTWTGVPSLRGMLGIRQGFTLPVPFVRGMPIRHQDESRR